MAHLTKAQKRRIIETRQDMVTYLRDLSKQAETGDLTGVIEFCNTASVKLDVECLLNASISDVQATALLNTPESTGEQYGERFGRAHATALNMKHTRQLCRTLMRQNRIEGIARSLAELLGEIEFDGELVEVD